MNLLTAPIGAPCDIPISPLVSRRNALNTIIAKLPDSGLKPPLIEHTIALWIRTEAEASESGRTKEHYEQAITAFRTMALTAGIDLDGFPANEPVCSRTTDETEQALAALGLIAQAWASSTSRQKQQQEGISANTYNNRLSIISSFYIFARERRLLRMDNPLDPIERRKVQDYVSARPLFKEQIAEAFAKIDRQTLAGKRDYALFLLLLATGRRASEVRELTWKDLFLFDGSITIHFHCKGGQELYDHLEPRVVRALLAYLKAMFGFDPREHSSQPGALIAPAQPIWLSLSHKRYLCPLSQRGLADIFERYFGMTRLHATRHTFALTMLKAGARFWKSCSGWATATSPPPAAISTAWQVLTTTLHRKSWTRWDSLTKKRRQFYKTQHMQMLL